MSNHHKWKREYSFVRNNLYRDPNREDFVSGSWLIFIGGQPVEVSNFTGQLDIVRTNQTPEAYNRQKGFEALNQPRSKAAVYLASLHFKKSKQMGFKLP